MTTNVDFRIRNGNDALRQTSLKPEPSDFCKIANAFFKKFENQPIDYNEGYHGVNTRRVSRISCEDTIGGGSFGDKDIPTHTLTYDVMRYVFFEWQPDWMFKFNEYVVDKYCRMQTFGNSTKITERENALLLTEGRHTYVFTTDLSKV